MATELDVLGLLSDHLSLLGVPFMFTGSFALAYYATPRMTRGLDIVVQLAARDVDPLVKALALDFYIDADVARTAIRDERLFNVMHLESGIKVGSELQRRDIRLLLAEPADMNYVRSWATQLKVAALLEELMK